MRSEQDSLAAHNERVKTLAGFLNALGIGFIGFAVLRPLTEDLASGTLATVWWGLAGLAFHALSHYDLGQMRREAKP